jgi:hypothetical protein
MEDAHARAQLRLDAAGGGFDRRRRVRGAHGDGFAAEHLLDVAVTAGLLAVQRAGAQVELKALGVAERRQQVVALPPGQRPVLVS